MCAETNEANAKLRCPKCQSTDRFSITAFVCIKVSGADYLEIIEEDGDRTYGSEETCLCDACGHISNMGEFYE